MHTLKHSFEVDDVKRFVLAAVLSIATVLAACRSSPPTRFFSLTPTDGQKITADGIGAVQVIAVHISESLDKQEIIRESQTGRVVVSNRNRWTSPLDELLRENLSRDLAQRLPPGTVALPDAPSPAGARRIVLDVLQFSGDTTGKVVLAGSWSLLPPGSDIPLLTREVHRSETTDPSDYANQVTAMSRLLGLLADEIARDYSESGTVPTAMEPSRLRRGSVRTVAQLSDLKPDGLMPTHFRNTRAK
jgi:uncharacterized lipoprotein YmbA